MLLGLAARLRNTRYGQWHHVLFALSFITAGVAIVVHPTVGQILPSAVLLILPMTRPRTSRIHDGVALLGAVGWAVVVFT
ncbi:MAG: hypothetical protein NTX15_06385 [Candidatus Kapabacteria bacterium]|nr:hypothetical protein [Candidatus Kapabacteria bacterium]